MPGSPEQNKNSSSEDSADSSDNTEKSGNSKKSTRSAIKLGGAVTESTLGETAKPASPKSESDFAKFDSILKRITGEPPKVGEPESESPGADKPDESARSSAREDTETNPELSDSETEATSVDSAESARKTQEAAQALINEELLDSADTYAAEASKDPDSMATGEAAESVSYRQILHDLAQEGTMPVEDIAEQGAQVMEDRIGAITHESQQPAHTEADNAEATSPESVSDDDIQPIVMPPPAAPIGASVSSGGPPNFNTPVGGSAYIPPNLPPHGSLFKAATAPIPSLAGRTSEAVPSDRGDETAAFGAGLLVGAVGGLWYGNRRGKKLGRREAEKQAAPVLNSANQKVRNLQESITAKDAHLRTLTREKLSAVQTASERQRMVDTLLAAPSTQRPITSAAASGEMFSRSRNTQFEPRVTEILLNDRYSREPADTRQARLQRQPDVIPFYKDIESFTKDELMNAAEKIVIEGTTLREMAQLGRLDQEGLRKIVGEYLKGGDVSRALSKETVEKELKYERDPKLRSLRRGQTALAASGVGGGGVPSDVAIGQDATVSGNGAGAAQSTYQGPKPAPDAATLRALRNKQTAVLTTTILVIMGAIIAALVLT